MANRQTKQTINIKEQSYRQPSHKNNYQKPSYNKISNVKQNYKQERINKKEQKQKMRARRVAELAEEKERVRMRKEQKIHECKKKRLQKTKAYSKRTKYGQPVMKDRIQLLLEQIQQMKSGNG